MRAVFAIDADATVTSGDVDVLSVGLCDREQGRVRKVAALAQHAHRLRVAWAVREKENVDEGVEERG